ncbi:recombinase family protein [Nocardia wallacei]|uniref:recombinase family protein n=1 Tax=Nocardia wallacei TaxID=480035 RepID=UPI0024562218|nr:recombinase family protein [Nocardia wallacei]
MARKTDDDLAWLVEINDALAAGLVGADPAEWVYGYVRISRDDKDGAEGVRLQAKHEVAYAERKGSRLAKIFCDNDMSGADVDRPALRELLKVVTPGPAKVVLARDVARLTRDYDLGNELMKLGRDEGVRFVFMKDHDYDMTTGAGRKNFMVKVAEAAEYRETNTENLLDRTTEEAEKGVMQGGSRQFGYGKVVGTHPITGADILDRCALRAEEVAVLEEGRDRVINGESQTSIITDWNMRGITTSEGAQWRVGKLSHLLLMEAYVIYDLGEHTDATGARCACLNNPEGNGIHHDEHDRRHKCRRRPGSRRAAAPASEFAGIHVIQPGHVADTETRHGLRVCGKKGGPVSSGPRIGPPNGPPIGPRIGTRNNDKIHSKHHAGPQAVCGFVPPSVTSTGCSCPPRARQFTDRSVHSVSNPGRHRTTPAHIYQQRQHAGVARFDRATEQATEQGTEQATERETPNPVGPARHTARRSPRRCPRDDGRRVAKLRPPRGLRNQQLLPDRLIEACRGFRPVTTHPRCPAVLPHPGYPIHYPALGGRMNGAVNGRMNGRVKRTGVLAAVIPADIADTRGAAAAPRRCRTMPGGP